MARRASVFHPFTSPPAPLEQTFEVTCSCGEVLTGQRQIEHQKIPCPECGRLLFVLPSDSYAGALPKSRRRPAEAEGGTSGRVIEKLNHLAFWTRIRESRTSLGGQLGAIVARARQWLKARLSGLRS